MAKIISQETFDDVVKENIVEFEMNVQEAKDETVKQFEAQGINLANIIKDLRINEATGNPVLNETIEQLKTSAAGDDIGSHEVIKLLETLANECKASVPHRVVSEIGKFALQKFGSKFTHKRININFHCQMAAKLGANEIIGKIIAAEMEKLETVDSQVSNYDHDFKLLIWIEQVVNSFSHNAIR